MGLRVAGEPTWRKKVSGRAGDNDKLPLGVPHVMNRSEFVGLERMVGRPRNANTRLLLLGRCGRSCFSGS
jgi:hypothetical protein